MLNFSGKFIKVFEPRIKLDVSERTVFCNLSSYRKDDRNDEPTYINSHWKDVAFVGEAFEPAKCLKGGEVIDVLRGAISYEKNAKNGNYYLNLFVFEFALSDISD